MDKLKGMRAKPFLIAKSSPTRSSSEDQVDEMATPLSTSVGSIQGAAVAWRLSPLYPMLEAWCRLTGSIWILNRIEAWAPKEVLSGISGEIPLGKLGLKYEPAGKVRVFAMVDCFTQWLMKPLHDQIFGVLRQIPQDGTFDQLRPIRSMLRRRWAKAQGMWSYDLSAATDRLPIVIQKVLLSPFLSSWGAEVWASLLIGRAYLFPGVKRGKGLPEMEPSLLHYGRGQPMGALSSWAMLAFTHHAIVQWAAARSIYKDKQEWFTDYAVLGDDIVIGDRGVAREYLLIMDQLGVAISVHKSLVSERRPVCEFAKRFFSKAEDLSGVPWPEALLGPRYFAILMDVVRAYKPRLGIIFNYLGYGYRVRGSLTKPLTRLSPRVRNVVLSLYAPGGPFALPVQDFFRLRSITSKYSADRWSRVVHGYLTALITQFRLSFDALDSLRDQVKTLVTVYRDREHYGTLAFESERVLVEETQREDGSVEKVYLATGRKAWESVSQVTASPRITESIRETVYREAFLDVVCELRDMRGELDQLTETVTSMEDVNMDQFLDLYERLNKLQDSVAELPLPRSLEMRKKDSVMRSKLLALVKRWYGFSKPFRSTK